MNMENQRTYTGPFVDKYLRVDIGRGGDLCLGLEGTGHLEPKTRGYRSLSIPRTQIIGGYVSGIPPESPPMDTGYQTLLPSSQGATSTAGKTFDLADVVYYE